MQELSKAERMKLFGILERVQESFYRHRWEQLSLEDQTCYLVWTFASDVNHGGFEYYYFNAGGDHALEAVAALDRVGAPRLKEALVEANTRFPGGSPPTDIDTRQVALDRIGDDAYTLWKDLDLSVFECTEPVEALLWCYIQCND